MPKVPSREPWRKRQRGDASHLAPGELRQAREVIAAFERADTAALLYPPGASTVTDAVSDLNRRLSAYLAHTPELEVSISPDEIEYAGQVVLDATESERSVSLVLDEGGVRRLLFREGVDLGEVTKLIDACSQARRSDEEDLVGLLWQRDLPNVGYVSVNFFSELDPAIEDFDPRTAKERLVDRLRGRGISVEQISVLRRSKKEEQDVEAPGDEGDGAYALTEQDLARLELLVRETQDDAVTVRFARIALGLLLKGGDDAELVAARIESLAFAQAQLVEEGRIAVAARLLMEMRRLAAADDRDNASGGRTRVAAAFKEFFVRAVAPEVTAALVRRLRREESSDVSAIQEYVTHCGEQGIELVDDLLRASAHEDAILAAAAGVFDGKRVFLRECATGKNAKRARTALRILAAIAGTTSQSVFLGALRHTDPSVRREAIRALTQNLDAHAFERFLDAFNDSEASNRLTALKAFCDAITEPISHLYPQALKLIEDASFRERASREQEILYTILAKIDPPQAISFFASVVQSRFALFRRKEMHTSRLMAIAALAETGESRAEELIRQTMSAAKDGETLSACTKGIERISALRVQRAMATSIRKRSDSDLRERQRESSGE